MISVTLPWPHRSLSPNARVHWAALSRAKRAYRRDCAMALLSQSSAFHRASLSSSERIGVHLQFCPPSRHRRDQDNLIASLKSGLDGLADVLHIDDHRFQVTLEILPEYLAEVRVQISSLEVT